MLLKALLRRWQGKLVWPGLTRRQRQPPNTHCCMYSLYSTCPTYWQKSLTTFWLGIFHKTSSYLKCLYCKVKGLRVIRWLQVFLKGRGNILDLWSLQPGGMSPLLGLDSGSYMWYFECISAFIQLWQKVVHWVPGWWTQKVLKRSKS